MKSIYFLVIPIVFLGCKRTSDNPKSFLNDFLNIKQSRHFDTIFVEKSKCIVPDYIYLDMDSLTSGNTYEDNNGNYGFYRVIFTMSEETKSLFCEKMTIIGDGKVRIDKRIQLPEDIASKKEYSYDKFIGWKSPEIIELKVYGDGAEETVYVNLSTQKFVSIK